MMINDSNIIYGGDLEEKFEYPTLGGLLVNHFRDGGDKLAIIDGLRDEKWSFKELLEQSLKLAKALYGAGLRQNEVVSILLENRLEYISIAYGTIFLNAIIAPTNFAYSELELDHTLGITKPKFVFISSQLKSAIFKLNQMNHVQKIIILDDDDIEDGKLISFSKFIYKYSINEFNVVNYVQKPIKLYDQVAAIFMSSGTTGLPKGVQLSHGNIISIIANSLEKVPLGKALFGELRLFNITPFFHVMGFMGKILMTSSREFTYIFLPKFTPKLFFECIQKYKIGIISIPPPIVHFLANTSLLDNYDLSSVKMILSGAAPLTKETEQEVIKRFNYNIMILQGYGQTEVTLGVLGSDPATAKPGSVGQVAKGVFAKVIDENGLSLGPNKVGELCFKGPLVMKGYLNNTEATSETIDKDGWLHSGDLGYYDEDKQFFIVDRLKELIKFKGYQVPPAELEGFLVTNPKIKDAGVIGIPDEKAGELPFAFIVKESNSDLTEEEVKQFVANNLSNPKWLRGGVRFVDEIPKSITGKILRREMKELYKSTKAKL